MVRQFGQIKFLDQTLFLEDRDKAVRWHHQVIAMAARLDLGQRLVIAGVIGDGHLDASFGLKLCQQFGACVVAPVIQLQCAFGMGGEGAHETNCGGQK